MTWIIIGAVAVAVWIFILYVLDRAGLYFWKFLLGCMGLFILMMVTVRPLFTEELARAVSALAGGVGDLTGTFSAYFKYGIIFIRTAAGSVTLKIDFECSGIIEIMAYISLLSFFRVYTIFERFLVGFVGTFYLIFANALRITLICIVVHFVGPGAYFVMHAIVGRLFFYFLSILLYYFVFTKTQVIRTKVGSFTYGGN